MARPERFELPTTWFEARYSIQLSYGRVGTIVADKKQAESGKRARAFARVRYSGALTLL